MSNPMKLPGFVDLQVNGYKGVDFSSPRLSEESFCFAAERLLSSGTAAFLPTVITSSRETYLRNLPLMARVIHSGQFRDRVLGIHLEGPFISDQPGAVGAHNAQWTTDPDMDYFDRLQELAEGTIRLVTVAAERPGACELIRHLTKSGVVVSLGHQMADYAQLQQACAAGAASVTHLGNAMPNQVHRHNNALLSGLAAKELTVMIITDGHHLPESVIRTVFNARPVAKIIVTSDASPVAGMSPGQYETLGNPAVLEPNGYLHNPQKQCLVGSSATMLQCMNVLARLDIVTVEELIRVGFDNPLALIGAAKSAIATQYCVLWNEATRQFELIKE